ncbi:conserved Plasmodium protein, unknown function [Plasmodium gallinaceum]|uniref:Uncharacterized protein n=1 Tax=Plasmodium gallinaceum TaxID=5849 RepID=A0A1J1GS95_PLAGA|nr:conserved Plasmodium protein, unknown function [Plasmodium gallinaceum]CRG95335.1 conserved Plasmodium protein, unknown function [Plasmodium gallinaceum]
MKMLKLNYYHSEIYEKYKINNILSLLVDKHKLQNESVDLDELSNKKNNYSIMAILGSQIKNINDDIYKNIDTNDIILALSELKKIDEQIVINENQNKNYILEIAKQIYYEYSKRGIIENDNSFNFNDKKCFMRINLELMNEINRGISSYENKIYKLRAFFEEDKQKRDFNTNRRSNEDYDNLDLVLNEKDIYYDLKKKNSYIDKNRNILNENIYNNNNNHEFIDRNEYDNIDDVNINTLKDVSDDNQMNNGYENYINLKKEKRNSHKEDNFYENYRNLNKDHPLNSKSNIDYNNKEETNSTYCNSIENLNDDLNLYNNRKSNYGNLYDFHLGEKNLFNDQVKMDYLKRKTHYEKIEEEKSESNRRSTINGNTHNLTNRISENIPRKSFYEEDNSKYNSNFSYYNNINDKYGKNKTFLNKEVMSDQNSNDLKVIINNSNACNSKFNVNSKKNTETLFNKNSKNTVSNVLENIDKAEQDIVNNHLKNSLSHNEYVARRMSSILLNPNIPQKETFNRNSYENDNIGKFVNRSRKNYNNDVSLNKYSSVDHKNNYTVDTYNNSSFIISTVKKPNVVDDSCNVVSDFENKDFSIRYKNNSSKENYMSNKYNYNILEQNNNTNTPLNIDNMSNFSRNIAKSVESNLNLYTNKYSRALDINDLNSNTSRNYVNSSNSLKSDLTMRDNYAKMLERSKSLTSHFYRAPLTHKYLKANI